MKSFREYLVEASTIDPSKVVIDTNQVVIDPQPASPPQQTPATQSSAPMTTAWPKNAEEVKAFQRANKEVNTGKPLAVDGLIGRETMMALAKAGIQPPAGQTVNLAGYKKQAQPARAQTGGGATRTPASDPNTYINAQGQEVPTNFDTSGHVTGMPPPLKPRTQGGATTTPAPQTRKSQIKQMADLTKLEPNPYNYFKENQELSDIVKLANLDKK